MLKSLEESVSFFEEFVGSNRFAYRSDKVSGIIYIKYG